MGVRGIAARVGRPLPDPDRARDIAHPLRAQITEQRLLRRFKQLQDRIGDADPARGGKGFQPRGKVDRVAEKIAVIIHHVAQMQPDAIADRFVRAAGGFLVEEIGLEVDGAAHRIADRGELDQHAIAGGFHDTSARRGDRGIEQRFTIGRLAREQCGLVGLDKAAVADHVGDHHGGQATLRNIGSHGETLKHSAFNLRHIRQP